MTQAFEWMKLAKKSTSRQDCTLLCSNVGYLVLKLFYYHLKKGPFDHILDFRDNQGPWTMVGQPRASSSSPINSGRSVPFDSDLSKDEKKVKFYQNQIEQTNIGEILEKDENEVLYGRAGYLSGGFQNLIFDFILGRHVALTRPSTKIH